MSVVLSLLGWALLLCLAMFIAAIVLPVRVELVLTKQERCKYVLALRAFGQFGPRITVPQKKTKAEKPKPKKAKKRSGRRSRWRADPTRVFSAVVRLVSDILHCIRIETLKMDVTFGTGDPAETGHVYGMLMPLMYGPAASPRFWLTVEPDFQKAVFGGRAEFAVSLVPASLLPPIARFGWSAFGPGR